MELPDRLTVLITTSPATNHPSHLMLEEVLRSFEYVCPSHAPTFKFMIPFVFCCTDSCWGFLSFFVLRYFFESIEPRPETRKPLEMVMQHHPPKFKQTISRWLLSPTVQYIWQKTLLR